MVCCEEKCRCAVLKSELVCFFFSLFVSPGGIINQKLHPRSSTVSSQPTIHPPPHTPRSLSLSLSLSLSFIQFVYYLEYHFEDDYAASINCKCSKKITEKIAHKLDKKLIAFLSRNLSFEFLAIQLFCEVLQVSQ